MKKTLSIVAIVALVAICCVALVACFPSNPTDAKANLEKNGYVAGEDKLVVPTALKLVGVNDLESVVTGKKGEDYCTLIYFKDANAAKEAYAKVEEYAKKEDGKAVIKKSGKVIYYGTDAGVKAAK